MSTRKRKKPQKKPKDRTIDPNRNDQTKAFNNNINHKFNAVNNRNFAAQRTFRGASRGS